jgi:GNAT superfamily N-acetyltransferase
MIDEQSTEIRVWGSDDVATIVDEMTNLYATDFVEPEIKKKTPDFYSEERFRSRVLEGYAVSPGFATVSAEVGGNLVGFVTAANIGPQGSWWKDATTSLDIDTTEDGHRTVAIFDLVVRKDHRRRGVAFLLHKELLAPRTNERATLLSSEPQQPAYSIWLKWGYEVIGRSKPDPNGPELDIFLKSLRS